MTAQLPLAAAPIDLSRRRLATVAVMLGLVVAALEATVISTAMPTIADALGDKHLYPWVFSSFLAAQMAGVLLCGRLADAIGRRPVFIGGMSVFLLGLVLAGGAQSMAALVAFRAIQGLGAGAIQPVAMTISADLYTLEERAKIQVLFTSVWGASNALGPLIGGLIVENLSWRWVFLVSVPFGLLASLVLMRSFKDPPRAIPKDANLGPALCAGVGGAMLLLAFEHSGPISALQLIAALSGAAMLGLSLRGAGKLGPLLDRETLSNRTVIAGLAASILVGGLLHVTTSYVPLWASEQRSSGAVGAGMAVVPLLLGWALGSTFGIKVLVRFGMRSSVGGGFIIAALGASALYLTTHALLPTSLVMLSLGLLGLGLGPAASTSMVASQSSVPWTSRGSVTSVIYAARAFGGSMGVAAIGAVAPQSPFAGVLALALPAAVLLQMLTPPRRA